MQRLIILILALAAHQHTGPMRKALARLKYEDATRLAQPLAAASLRPLAFRLNEYGSVTTLVTRWRTRIGGRSRKIAWTRSRP